VPFDLSRLALAVGDAKGADYYGGFSFLFWDYLDKESGVRKENTHRPRVLVKLLDSKRAFMGLTTKTRQPDKEKLEIARGRFLDLRTLTFALTGSAMSLRSAGERFEIEHPKTSVEEHGVVDEASVDYCRRDTLATGELLETLRAEYDKHPITLPPEHAFSPASIAKAYLKQMGVESPTTKFSVRASSLGVAMTTYFGGRAEVRIRKTEVPAVYCDFLSMYPTVNALMGLWEIMTAKDVEVVTATKEVQALLNTVTTDRCFDPGFWKDLRFYAFVEPDPSTTKRPRYRASV
jgi:hypothetical protein